MAVTLIILGLCAVLAYCYVGYPLLILGVATSRSRRHPKAVAQVPSVSIILAVYNEDVVLRRCLDSLLELDYPAESVEILVGSDGSSDDTDSILEKYGRENPRLRVQIFTTRRGKIPVVNDLVRMSSGSILLFTDADVTLDRLALQQHAVHYGDDEIGGVAGNLVLAGEQSVREGPLGSERYYMSIENVIRDHEARILSTVGIFGGHYSIRREYWRELPDQPICDELYIGLSVIESGARMTFEPRAIAREHFGRSMSDEFKRKTRFASRGFNTLRLFSGLMMPTAGWTSVMLWSHKVLRWLTPFVLLFIGAATVVAATQSHSYALPLLIGEAFLGVIVLLGAIVSRIDRRIPMLPHAYWFLTMNVAFALGTIRFLFKREQHFWAQTRRIADITSPRPKEAAHS